MMARLISRRARGLGLAALCLCLPVWAAAADLADSFSTFGDPAARMDHGAWQQLLDDYLVESPDGVNRFAYGEVSEADGEALDNYLAALQALNPKAFGRDAQMAYWINLYNAETVRVILAHYPLASIRDISYSLFSRGPWKEPLLEVNQTPLSLDNVEHDILRPVFADHRIHYAVNCASIGCPNLQREAYTADNLESLLDAGEQAYVNHQRGVAVVSGRARLSSIYDWYGEDFADDEAGLLEHLRARAAPDLAEALEGVSRVSGYDYDWALNEAAAR